MVKLNQLSSARKFGPGYFIKEQMEAREWTQADMAEILGITLKHVNKILNEKQPISLDMARVLGEVFDTSVQFWMNLDTSYRLWLDQEKSDKEKEADIKAKVFERMPVKDMVKKGWLPSFQTTEELVTIVLKFWDWNELKFDKIDKLIESDSCLTRKSEAYTQFNKSYKMTWYRMAQKIARDIPKNEYNPKELLKLYKNLHQYTSRKNGISLFLDALGKIGVIFFVLPHLQKTYLDGAAFMCDKNPVVVYTGRYKRIDNFWFTMAHELAHVIKHIKIAGQFILDNFKDKTYGELEEEADNMASKALKHKEVIIYLRPYLNYLSTVKVEECAKQLEIHPSIIIGKLAHDKEISYRNIHLYNQDVLEEIPKKYILSFSK